MFRVNKRRVTEAVRLTKLRDIMDETGRADLPYLQMRLRADHGIKVAQSTIKRDRRKITDLSDRWVSDLARRTWMTKIIRIYQESSEETVRLRGLLNTMLDDVGAADEDAVFALAIRLLEEDPKGNRGIAETIMRNARLASSAGAARSIAAVDARLTDKRNSIIAMATDVPLYDLVSKMQAAQSVDEDELESAPPKAGDGR